MGNFTIDRLKFINPTLRAFDLEISATIDPEVDVGWNSSVAVSLFHHHHHIGEATLPDRCIIPNEFNKAIITLENFEIRNMTAFKGFFQNLMPENDINQEKAVNKAVTATLDHHDNGHKLFITINLSDASKMSIDCLTFHRCDNRMQIYFVTLSSSPVDMDFGRCQFILKKDKEILAFLNGHIALKPGRHRVLMEGFVNYDVDDALLDGTGTLTGSTTLSDVTETLTGLTTYELRTSFLAHAIRLFEIQVELS